MAKPKAAPAPAALAATPPAEAPVPQDATAAAAPVETPPAAAPAPEAAPAPAALAVPPGFLPVTYVGKRPTHTDGLYGTRIQWDSVGSVQLVPEDAARKMMSINKDVYQPGEYGGQTAPAVQAQKMPDDTERQDLDIVIQTMDKDALENYARTHFRQELDKRRTVETLRQEVSRLIDQFGVPA